MWANVLAQKHQAEQKPNDTSLVRMSKNRIVGTYIPEIIDCIVYKIDCWFPQLENWNSFSYYITRNLKNIRYNFWAHF